MLAATGARLDLLDLSAVGPMAGGVWEEGNGTLGGAGQCDAAFSQPIHCLDGMLAEQSQVSRRSPVAVVPTPGITTLAYNSTSIHALPALLASVYDARNPNPTPSPDPNPVSNPQPKPEPKPKPKP